MKKNNEEQESVLPEKKPRFGATVPDKVKLNCWEHKKCGKGPGAESDLWLAVCPAAREGRLDGVHGGVNAGRACWVVAGTFCGGRAQGIFAQKYESCKVCNFYQMVIDEEMHKFELTLNLMKKLKE